MKRSPFFFMRQQAQKRLQTYSLVTTVLILVTVFSGGFLLQPGTVDTAVRFATITNAKPVSDEVRSLVESNTSPTIELLTENGISLDELATSGTLRDDEVVADNPADLLTQVLTLPVEFDRYEATADLTDSTTIGELAFSTKISTEYTAVDATDIFPEGAYTIYATFDYDAMQDGMVWAWVWRRNGKVVSGGNEQWNYGQDGPGYIYYNPEEGFSFGNYTLEVWVNGELFAQSEIVINTAAATANQ